MTQVEFEKQLRELRNQQREELSPIETLILELREQEAQGNVLINEMQLRKQRTKEQRQQLASRLHEKTEQWRSRIADFMAAHQDVTRELENISTLAIVRELQRRGFQGELSNDNMNDEQLPVINLTLNTTVEVDDGKIQFRQPTEPPVTPFDVEP